MRRPAPAAVSRFRNDLARLCAVDTVRLLVAVSGGPDSLALLLLAHEVLGERCAAATVDHGMRAESAGEAAFVHALCADRGIAHRILSDPAPGPAPAPGNVSARLRLLRYGLLEREIADTGADRLATAHHLEDQRETVVMRLARGSGVAGLAGIRERQGPVIRPVLGWRRVELAAVVADCGVVAIDDPSNTDDRYDRARLRKLLAGADWLDPARVARSARALADAEDALAWATGQAGAQAIRLRPAEATLLPEALPFELVRRLAGICLRHVRPASAARGGDIATLVASLACGQPATLAGVMVTIEPGDTPMWCFREAPPHR